MKKFLLLALLSASCYAAEVDTGTMAMVNIGSQTFTCSVVIGSPLIIQC